MNPYLAAAENVGFDNLRARRIMCKAFSFSIPTEEAINYCVQLCPIIDIDAGPGYWAYLIEQSNGVILTIDKDPPQHCWVSTIKSDHTILAKPETEDLTLMLSWPPYKDPMAYEAIKL